jgi:monoamine oxidase
MSEEMNTVNLVSFEAYVAEELKRTMRREYDRSVNRDLSSQNWRGLFKRNVTLVLRQTYDASLVQLQQLSFGGSGSHLTLLALKAFDGMVEEFLHYVLQKHRGSCALSNFPEEHNPSEAYVEEVLAQINRDWQAFAKQVSGVLGVAPITQM